MHTLRLRALGATLFLAIAGCNGDEVTRPALHVTGKALVLITYGQPGVSVVGDTGSSAGHVDFGDAFDGSAFTIQGDTVWSTSSKFGGDELFFADVGSDAVRTVRLPAGSNPGGVAVLPRRFEGANGADAAVALRDSGAVALVARARGTDPSLSSFTLVRGAGVCPTDVFVAYRTLWSIDSNENCRDQYQVLGPTRLIGIGLDSTRRDTTVIAGAYGAGRALPYEGNVGAFVVTSGDYGEHPGAVSAVAGTASRIGTPTIVTRFLPAGWYATAGRLGHDQRIYVTASLGYPNPYLPRVFAIDMGTMAFTGTRADGQDYLDLRDAGGALVRCDAATADTDGTIYCASNGGVTSHLLVFGPTGTLIRDVPTGGVAADVEVR